MRLFPHLPQASPEPAPASLPPAEAARLRKLLHDPAARAAGGRVLAELRRLVGVLRVSDLVAAAADEAEAPAALERMAEALKAECRAFLAQRDTLNADLQRDAVARYQFDNTAVLLLTQAESLAERHDLAAREALRAAQRLNETLAGAGLTEDELAAIARLRRPAGLADEAADRLRSAGLTEGEIATLAAARAAGRPEVGIAAEHRRAASAARAEVAALATFLADPLREVDELPPELAAGLLERYAAMARLQTAGPTVSGYTPPVVAAIPAPAV